MKIKSLKNRGGLAVCFMSGIMFAGCKSAPESAPSPAAVASPSTTTPPASAKTPTTPPLAKASVSPPTTQPIKGTVLQVSPESAQRILAGTQTSTTRKGIRTLPVGPASLLSGTRQIPIEITRLTRVKFSDLSDADARTGGTASLADLKDSLLKFNPDLKETDDMTVIHFRLKQ